MPGITQQTTPNEWFENGEGKRGKRNVLWNVVIAGEFLSTVKLLLVRICDGQNGNAMLFSGLVTWRELNTDLIKSLNCSLILYEAGPSWSYTPCIFISEQEKIYFVHFRQTLCNESDHEEHQSKLFRSHILFSTWWELKPTSITIPSLWPSPAGLYSTTSKLSVGDQDVLLLTSGNGSFILSRRCIMWQGKQ